MEKMVDPSFWAQFGPWAVLCVLLLFAMGIALQKIGSVLYAIFQAQSETLDKRHVETLEVVRSNTTAMTLVGERLSGVENRVKHIEDAVFEDGEGKISHWITRPVSGGVKTP